MSLKSAELCRAPFGKTENWKASHRDGLFAFLSEDFFLVQSVSERMRRGGVGSGVELALQKKKAHNPLTENALKDNLESIQRM